jgi:magnesium-protoporphyrin IX monomethyl ester (oxidative) cyclase
LTLDTDHPAFRRGLDRLCEISAKVDAAKTQGGVLGLVKRGVYSLQGAAVFARLYLLPVKPNALPAQIRVAPVW